jgi:hypothetical protein
LWRRIRTRWQFSRNETLTVYISCLFSCIVPGHGSENFFVPNLLGVFYYGSRENKWLELWGAHLKPHLTPALHTDGRLNRAVVEGWYQSINATEPIPWAAWLIPLLVWSSLVLAIWTMLGCLSAMLRAQWSQREALAFPLLRLPLEMTEHLEPGRRAELPFFRNPVMWMGFWAAVALEGINGLAVYFPDVPRIPLQLTGTFFSEPPWNQIGDVPLIVYPIYIGITFLLTSEVSFSLWFFFWFIKLQLIAAYFAGIMPAVLPNALGSQGKVFTGYQHVGAYIAYTAVVLWAAREHLTHVLWRAFGRTKPTPEEAHEPLSYPVAFWGFIAAFAFIIFWCWMAGINLVFAIALWLLYLIIAIGLSRIVVEGGLLLLEAGWYPTSALAQYFTAGSGKWISLENGLAPAMLLQGAFMVDLRGMLMPSFVQGFKLAHDRGIRLRPLLALIVAVTLISFSIGVFMNVWMGYRSSGGGLMFHSFFSSIGPRIPAWNLDSLLHTTDWQSGASLFWTSVGALETYGLMVARARFAGFPLHPLGLLVCLTSTINQVWLSVFCGWLCKVLVTRFGGNSAYRRLVPAALGLVLGDVVMIVFWLLIAGWQGRTGHQLLPG